MFSSSCDVFLRVARRLYTAPIVRADCAATVYIYMPGPRASIVRNYARIVCIGTIYRARWFGEKSKRAGRGRRREDIIMGIIGWYPVRLLAPDLR